MTEELMRAPRPDFIFTWTQYSSNAGFEIHKLKVVIGVAPPDFPRFASPPIQVQMQHPQTKQVLAFNGRIPIPATDLEEAFRIGPSHLKMMMEELQKQMKAKLDQPTIVVPGAQMPSDIEINGQQFKLNRG